MRQSFIALVTILLLSACSKEDNLAGEVVGFWQLTEMWDGNEVETHDDIFYGFQNSMVQIQYTNRTIENSTSIYRGRYWNEGDSLCFTILDGGSVLPIFRLKEAGAENVNKFKVEKITDSQMIWSRGDNERFVFQKY